MSTLHHHLFYAALASAIAIAPATGNAQMPGGAPKYAPDVPAKITTPDTVETRIGTLRFKDGAPDAGDGAARLRPDRLQPRHRRVHQGHVGHLGVCDLSRPRGGGRQAQPAASASPKQLMDARSLFLTANTTTVYVADVRRSEGRADGRARAAAGARASR
ncbi:MAG: hypothetical protein MZW92_70840 [Comamonadaceae bacterium]|nr:hypothetical protein [Comamonadaceae bacterium]